MVIIKETKGLKNLDDVMKGLYQEYYKKQGRGFTDEEFQKMVESVVGKPIDDFFQKYIFGTETIDYNTFFEAVGLQLKDKNIDKIEPYLGTEFRGGGLRITSVMRDSPAYNDGLNVSDEILQVDGSRPDDIMKFISNKKIGDIIEVKVRRDGLEKKYNITLQRNPTKNLVLEPLENQTKAQQEMYKKWLYL